MKKKTTKTLLPIFLLTFFFWFFKFPIEIPSSSDDPTSQVMPLSSITEDDAVADD